MKNVRKVLILTTSFLFAYSASAKNLCLSEETEVMACQLNEVKKRSISICYNESKDEAFYRIGKDNNNLEMTKKFTKGEPLLRWLETVSFSTNFGFKNGSYYYQVSVPEETFGANASLEVIDKNKKNVMLKFCTSNSFGKKTQKSKVVVDVDNDVAQGNSDAITPFPVMFYENNNEKLLLATKNVINYESIGKMNTPISSNEIDNYIYKKKISNNSIKSLKYPIYTYEQAKNIVPRLDSFLKKFFSSPPQYYTFFKINETIYIMTISSIGLDDPKMNAYSLISLSIPLYNIELGNGFETTKDKKLKYRGDMGEPKSLQLD